MRKTKIICTMGPAVSNVDIMKQLLISGMNIARFNFSHGDHEYHKNNMDMLREASRQTSIPVALLLDTKGPEIRTGIVKDNKKINLERGKHIILTTEEVEGTAERLSISYKALPGEISAGKHIYIADGLVDLEVEKVSNFDIHCIIRSGAEIGSRKNVNVVGVRTSLPAITEKDIKDIMFGIENQVDFIAASFVRKPSDIKEIRGIIDICDVDIDIIAKVEDQEGLDNIDEIIRVANGVMVARGDLGVQLPPEEIPLVQKRIIRKCNMHNKPVIVATQMLDSMIDNPSPTRAEVTDVANAILDGTDAIMLSGETASGKYPSKTVEMMNKIALQIEKSDEYKSRLRECVKLPMKNNMADTVARSAYFTAKDIGANAILTPSLHGNTPKLISKYRPDQYILAVTPYEHVRRKLLLYWGVYSIISEVTSDSDSMLENAIEKGIKHDLLNPFDKLVILAGVPINSPIMLNTIRVHLIANVLGKSLRGYGKTVSGKIVKVKDVLEAKERIKGDGTEILLAKYIDELYKPILSKIKGYILEEFSSISWEEIHSINPELVALAGAYKATETLKDGQMVTLDGEEKLIFEGVARVKHKEEKPTDEN